MANMDAWGVSETGFYRPTLEDIINEKNKKAKKIFGEDFETGELTPQGKFFRICAAAESKLCEIGESIYYSFAPSTARGISLDRVCEFANLTRESAGYAIHRLRVFGTFEYVVPAGTVFKNNSGITFYSSQDAVISNEETAGSNIYYALVTVQCTESGTIGNVTDINDTNEVNTDIKAVTWYDTVAYGTPIESDPDLRNKFNKVVQGIGTNTSASIKANLLRVDGVNDVIIINNNTTENIPVGSLTVASGSYAVIVHSDDTTIDNDIATAIFEKHPLGVIQSGIKSVTIKDEANVEHIMKFSYVETQTIDINIKCVVDDTFTSISDGVNQITNNVTSYINGLGIGETVVFSRLYDYIYNVTGVYEVSDMTINGDRMNIPVEKLKIAKVGNVTVDITEG